MSQLQSIRALMRGVLDYAGLFPPAGLDMADAVAGYARYRKHVQSGILSRFICPAGRLRELESAAGELWTAGGEPWPLSILGRGAGDGSDYLKGLREDLDHVADFLDRRAAVTAPDVLELPLPPGRDCADPDRLRGYLAQTLSVLTAHRARPEAVFFEVSFGTNWEHEVPAAILAVAEHSGAETAAGVKIRTGGLSAASFPAPAQVATFITSARDAGTFFKATAGLHHPFRHLSREVGTMMHGFLNVFGGAVLAHTLDLDRRDLQVVLEQERPGRLLFDEGGITWDGARAGLAEIEAARAGFAVSFGSCSFTEPIEDLKSLGLI